MATDDELRDLTKRIGLLSTDDRLRLLEMVLADAKAARVTDEEAARQELKAMEERYLKRQRSAVPVEENAREAG